MKYTREEETQIVHDLYLNIEEEVETLTLWGNEAKEERVKAAIALEALCHRMIAIAQSIQQS